MPLYVYICAECDIELEELRPAHQADWPPVECPICHGLCERSISLFSIQARSKGARPLGNMVNRVQHQPDHMADCPCCRRKNHA